MLELNDFLPKEDLYDEVLFNELKEKIENPKIHNIGIIGNYGAGKSSFIKSFFNWYEKNSTSERFDYDATIHENRNGKDHFFHFSFSDNHIIKFKKDFDNENISVKIKSKDNKILLKDISNKIKTRKKKLTISLGNLNAADSEFKSEEIEKCILKQMLYSVDGSELPNSRLNRIEEKENDRKKNIKKGIYFLLISILAIITFNLFRYSDLANHGIVKVVEREILENGQERYIENNINNKANYVIRIISIIVFLASSAYSVICFMKSKLLSFLLSNFESGKISAKFMEAEISKNRQENYLSESIDEVINFFIHTDYKIIIFEDIDRYNKEDVFLHLRELNQILNAYFENLGLDKITFIYSVRGDTFCNNNENKTSLELVKFFDFCIPIIPYANALNIGDMLLKLQSEKNNDNIFKQLDPKKLIILGSYITDIRIFNNIINEYQIYCHKMEKNPLFNYQEMFSLVVLKNTDFSFFNTLETEKENLTLVFSLKEQLKNKILDIKKIERNEIEKENNQVNGRINNAVKSVQVKYLKEFYKNNPEKCSKDLDKSVDYFANEFEIKIDELINKGHAEDWDVNFEDPESSDLIASADISVEDFNNFTIDKQNYSSKLELTLNSFSDELYEIYQNKDKLQKEIDFLYTSNMKDLYEKYENEGKELLQNMKKLSTENGILSYILKGLITEYYDKTISYFYEGQLSKNDLMFINYVKSSIQVETTSIELTHINNVINELSETLGYNNIIINEQILNYSLFIYLIENNISIILDSYLKFIEKKQKYNFINQCLEKYGEKKEIILTYIFLHKPTLFYNLSNSYSEPEKLTFYKMVLSFESLTIPRRFNNYPIKLYLSKNKKNFKDVSDHCLINLGEILRKD